MSLSFDTFRSQRYLRTRFLEGRYLLAQEGTDLELEMIDFSRVLIKNTLGNIAVDVAWKTENYKVQTQLGSLTGLTFNVNTTLLSLVPIGAGVFKNGVQVTTITNKTTSSITVASVSGLSPGDIVELSTSNSLLIRPGEAWFEGLPFVMRSGVDQVVSGSILPLGTAPNSPAGVSIQDDPQGRGKVLTFTGGVTPSNNYQIVIEASEENITNVQDPFLKNINIPEATATKQRLIYKIYVVTQDSQNNTPIPYPTSINLTNYVEVIPQASGNGELISTTILPASPVDGSDLELVIRNNPALVNTAYPGNPTGNLLPISGPALLEYASGKLVDSLGQEFWINTLTTTSPNLVIRVDKEVGQGNPQIINGVPYRLLKRDVYVADPNSGTNLGTLRYPVANVIWDTTSGFSTTAVQDLRKEIDSLERLTIIERQDRNAKLIKGGTWSWDQTTGVLSWNNTAFVQLVGSPDSANQINSGNINLASDGMVAYVKLNRTTTSTQLQVLSANISSLTLDSNTFVIARRTTNNVIVANSFLLKNRESLELDGALADINRKFDQLNVVTHETQNNKVRVLGADSLQLNGSVYSKQLNNLIINFSGAVINFTTGEVLASDDSTALGNDFTPVSIPSGEYFWYGIGVLPDTTDVTNKATIKLQITPAATSDVNSAVAPLPSILGNQKLGAVQVFNNAGTIQVHTVRRITDSSGGGSGAGNIFANLYDPVSTTLPNSASVTIDGVSLVNGDTVLFTNLNSNNNRIYQVAGIGTGATWTALNAFSDSSQVPAAGESVVVINGNFYQGQKPYYTHDGKWLINDTVRFFDGDKGTNFWEMSSIKTFTLEDDSTGEIFRVSHSGSENMIINYSLSRSGEKQVGQLYLTTDGLDAYLTNSSVYSDELGVTFDAIVDSTDLVLEFTTSAVGDDATLKYYVQRWSDSPGGPSGIPNYSSGGGGDTPAAGNIGDVQYKGNDGMLAADSRFAWDGTNAALNLNGMYQQVLSSSIALANDTSIATPAFIYPASRKFSTIEYSLERDGECQVGRLLIATNGVTVSITDDFIGTSVLGVIFSADISAGNVRVLYTTTNTGFAASLKYSTRRWS